VPFINPELLPSKTKCVVILSLSLCPPSSSIHSTESARRRVLVKKYNCVISLSASSARVPISSNCYSLYSTSHTLQSGNVAHFNLS
jgi:hypothetical protein